MAEHLESRVATVESEIQSLTANVNSFIKSSEVWRTDVSRSLQQLNDKISEKTAPNFGTMAAWAGTLLTFIAMVAAPIAYHFNDAISGLDHKLQKEYQLVNDTQRERQNSIAASLLELDTRLQREFLTANATLRATADALSVSTDRAAKILSERIDKIDDWTSAQLKADLEELRKRRMEK